MVTAVQGTEWSSEQSGALPIDENRKSRSTSLTDRRSRGSEDHVDDPVLSVVVPVFNEQEVLPELHRRLTAVMGILDCTWEIVYVDDGSSDGSAERLIELRKLDCKVALVTLSRNFGKEIAVTAGLDFARGQAAVVIDADLQDPPEVITQLVDLWRHGYDMVYATRRERKGETLFKRTTVAVFYRVIGNLSETEIPRNTGDFRLISRRCIDGLQKCRERRRFMKGYSPGWGLKAHQSYTTETQDLRVQRNGTTGAFGPSHLKVSRHSQLHLTKWLHTLV